MSDKLELRKKIFLDFFDGKTILYQYVNVILEQEVGDD